MRKKELYDKVIAYFEQAMPVAETELNYSNPFELLIAVILSAQNTHFQEIRLRNSSHANYVVSFFAQKLRSNVTLLINMPYAKRNTVVSSANECIARETP